MSRPAHPPDCKCSNCHLSSKLFPRGPNDRIILPRPSPGSPGYEHTPKSPSMDRARMAPPRPQSTAPHEYRPSRHAHAHAPPMPPPPRGYAYGDPSSSPSTSRRSLDQRAPPPMHRPVPSYPSPRPPPQQYQQEPEPDRLSYTFAPPDRPASAMAGPMHHSGHNNGGNNHGNLEWVPPKLKWVKKKDRVSHFTPPSQYQGTSFRQYVHDGVVPTRPNN
ncbi:hypothetical protein R3P38DRAFT_2531872 [Favolaschia claudopus]|uniref:Uncharacterized protein n=1 Tax=Favolaschia claudopus TaxID=2862362 RepID=A0AAW0BAB3_9AGAR